jgi:hypothetical protein
VFNVAVRTAIENCQDAILNSEPAAVAEREGYYAAMRGMNMIMGELAACVHLARALTQRELEEEDRSAGAWDAHLSGN